MDQNKLEITQKTAGQIKYFRMQKGLSQKKLANLAGLNSAFLGHIERSLKCPTVDTLDKIASAMNISLSELLDFDDKNEDERKAKAIQRINFLIRELSTQETEQISEIIADIIQFEKKS